MNLDLDLLWERGLVCTGGLGPRFPQKPQFGITASLIHSVQYILLGRGHALPPVRWLFDLYCARVVRAGRIQRTSQTWTCYGREGWCAPVNLDLDLLWERGLVCTSELGLGLAMGEGVGVHW